MLVFGLVPNEAYLKQILKDFEIRFNRPQFINTDDLTDPQVKVQSLIDYSKQKPYNKYFVYKIEKNGFLEISHVSFEVLKEIYTSNKYLNAL